MALLPLDSASRRGGECLVARVGNVAITDDEVRRVMLQADQVPTRAQSERLLVDAVIAARLRGDPGDPADVVGVLSEYRQFLAYVQREVGPRPEVWTKVAAQRLSVERERLGQSWGALLLTARQMTIQSGHITSIRSMSRYDHQRRPDPEGETPKRVRWLAVLDRSTDG